METKYDRIGEGYDATRRADPGILAGFMELLDVTDDGAYLDVACGTGNYTSAIAPSGGRWFAFDLSETMLSVARRKSDRVEWRCCDVADTGYESDQFDAAMCSLAVHHFPNLSLAFAEIARVIKPNGRFVTFMSTPDRMRGYWLNEYFPEMLAKARAQMPSLEAIRDAMSPFGLVIRSTRPFFVTPSLQDLFLYSGKQRPEMYLSPRVRQGISSFRTLSSESELEAGLARLKEDIETGRVRVVMDRYQNEEGDYVFVVASKERESVPLQPSSGSDAQGTALRDD